MKRIPVSSRRQFLAKSAAAIGFPTIIPASVIGQNAPSSKITMAVFGWGMMGPGNTAKFLQEQDCQIVAACDIDKGNLQKALDTINGAYKNKDCKPYHDYREVMARKDIDTVMLALPDNWHALTAIEAAKNGKDIYGEKPLARTIAEQQAIVKAVQKHGRIWQTGSWQRSEDNFRIGAEIVRNGLIGKLKEVHVGLPSGHNDFAKTGDKRSVTPPPAELDYEMWIGPATMQDYIECRIHKNWRWDYNIGGGQLLDWIGHHCDIAHWGMNMDSSGPIEISPIQVDMPPRTDIWNTATKYRAEAKYAGDITMTIAGGHDDIKMGTKWIGTDGWVYVNRGGAYDCSIPALKQLVKKRKDEKDPKSEIIEVAKAPKLGDDVIKTRLYETKGHHRNFLDCVKSRQPTVTPVETAHRSASPGHLALISFLTNRSIKWDPVKEEIIGDADASKLLTREYRGPWKLEA
ncbi:MAG: dehydrogenase [Chthoniobacter sp. 12-60-6]|nr:MAG: dehydrogenase [Chthoniobacter sp. 12-60-6]